MSIYCPILEHKVTYIHCQDCDKECRQSNVTNNDETKCGIKSVEKSNTDKEKH